MHHPQLRLGDFLLPLACSIDFLAKVCYNNIDNIVFLCSKLIVPLEVKNLKKRLISALIVVVTVLATLGVIKAVEYFRASKYDHARMRTARLAESTTNLDCDAFNLFRFNTDQIYSDELRFPDGLALEYSKSPNNSFCNPIEFMIDYEGHDWDGNIDDEHRLVFVDGSTVEAQMTNRVLWIRYYAGWNVNGNILTSGPTRELFIMPDGTRVWRKDGRITRFKTDTGAWYFRGRTAYFCSNKEYYDVDLPFNYDGMQSWCSLDNGVCTFAIYEERGYVLWVFANGDIYQLYASPSVDLGSAPSDFVATNFNRARSDGFIAYDLPTGRIKIDMNGDIIKGD